MQAVFDGSLHDAVMALVDVAERQFSQMPDELSANRDVFVPIYETFPTCWEAVICDDRIVAFWTVPFLLPEDEALFRAGKLIESEMDAVRIHRPVLPDTYFAYCTGLVICQGHEAASSLLLSSFAKWLEDLARREVFLRGIGTVSVSPGGAQICRDLGMQRLGTHCSDASFEVWDLPGAAIATSVFSQRSPFLQRAYADKFKT